MIFLVLIIDINLLAGTGPPQVQSKILVGRRYESPFSVEDLLTLVIPKKQSNDVDMDPCKSATFIGKTISFFLVLSVKSLILTSSLSLRRYRVPRGGQPHSEDKEKIS